MQTAVVFNKVKQGSLSIYCVNSHEVESRLEYGYIMLTEVLGSASKCTEISGTMVVRRWVTQS